MQGLTRRQREILDFIETYVNERRHSPSYREIQKHFSFSSLGSVYNHIQALKKKGALECNNKASRSLFLKSHAAPPASAIPLVGKLCDKSGIETFAESVMIPLPPQMVPEEGECYLLQIEGNTLKEELMLEGDFLLVQPRPSFEEGETVIALVGGHTTIVKRVYHENDHLRFESINPLVQPLILRKEHVQIQGAIISLFRHYTAS
ncbi:MAG: transcriptional repressor LexA [Chlamydiales bacterium]